MRRPGVVTGRVIDGAARSDGGRRAVPARVLLLRAGGQGVVELAELGVHARVQVVEDLRPRRGLVVAAGEQQLPRLGLAVALAPLGDELRQVAVLRGGLLLRRRPGRQPCGVAALEHTDDRLDDVRPHCAALAHVCLLVPTGSSGAFPTGCPANRSAVQDAAPHLVRPLRGVPADPPEGARYDDGRTWRIRLVAYGARLESGLGATPREFESPILRRTTGPRQHAGGPSRPSGGQAPAGTGRRNRRRYSPATAARTSRPPSS